MSQKFKFWLLENADRVGHKLRLPRRLLSPLCDRYDMALGMPDTPENFPERWRKRG